jgi:hypothetical protein
MFTFIVALLLGFILGRAHFGPRPQLVFLNLPFFNIAVSREAYAVLPGERSFHLGPLFFLISVDGHFD